MRIRELRSRPPGRATTDERRAVFGAALGQFDDLLTAAAAIGPAARPLPLYYALNQAGRAIIAARQSPEGAWKPRSHGLSIGEPVGGRLQGTTISPHEPKRDGAFTMLAQSLGAEVPSANMTLSRVWAAIPGLARPGLGAGCPRPLLVEWPALSVADHVSARGLDAIGTGPAAVDVVRRLIVDTYPSAADGLEVLHVGPEPQAPTPAAFANLKWERSDGRLWYQASTMPYLGNHYLVPAVAGTDGDIREPILLWWCLLQALSSLARYHSAEWTAALQPDSSPWCVAIEQTLEMALEVVPRLVYTALVWPRPVD